MVRTQLSTILAVCLFILFKKFSHHRKKIIWFGLGGLLLVHSGTGKKVWFNFEVWGRCLAHPQ
jgi:hypothetical protein